MFNLLANLYTTLLTNPVFHLKGIFLNIGDLAEWLENVFLRDTHIAAIQLGGITCTGRRCDLDDSGVLWTNRNTDFLMNPCSKRFI